MQSDGDFDGDGRRDFVIVDKATGDYRIGYQLAPGTFTWVPARASGVAGATGLGIGKLNSLTFDSLVFTGPDANRINILDANNTSAAGLPASVFISSLGPNIVAAIDIGGGGTTHDDLYVASLYNGAAAFRQTLVRNIGTPVRTELSDIALSYLRERGNPVLLRTNLPPRIGVFDRSVAAGTDEFKILDLSSGSAVTVASALTLRTPKPYDYVVGQFIATNPYLQVLFYPPGASHFYTYQVTEVSGTYSLVPTNSFTLTNEIERLFILPGTNATRLLVLDTDGVTAVVYAFNGQTAPTALQTITAAPGEHFTGAGISADGGFTAYSAPQGRNTSASFRQYAWNGAAYASVAAGNLPGISSYSASGNVMQFQYEPFVNNNPTLLRLNSAGDWTAGLALLGSPATVSVRSETFLSSSQGLANPTLTTLGTAHPLAAFGMANQYSNMISLFSFTPPAGDKISEVTISPPPGIYPTSIALQFTAANATDLIFFRIGSGPWIAWSSGLLAQVYTNTTVQYYGRPSSGTAKSSIKSAAYSFTQPPATRDSKGDGIPDYVKIALGLPLTGSRDADEDGYSDLEELIHGKNPLSAASVPTNFPHLDDLAAFDVNTTPRPWDGFSNSLSYCATGVVLHAYDFQSTLVGAGLVASNTWPLGPISNIVVVPDNRLVVQATDPHYGILTSNTDKIIGREMIGLVAVPAVQFPPVPYMYGGGNLATEAQNWIVSASNVLNNMPHVMLTRTLAANSTLESALFEMKIAQILQARGYPWWSNITLFPFRVTDAVRTNPPQPLLLSLELATNSQPGYKLQTAFGIISNLVQNSASPQIASLRAVVQDIYRIDSRYNNSNPATFALPLDELRYFLRNSTLDADYLPLSVTAGQFASANSGATAILAAVTGRPTTNVNLVVRNDTVGGPCRILDLFGGGPTFTLLDSGGLPFAFPDNFLLPPGSIVQVAGYTDVAGTGCAYPAIEVTSVLLASVPIATDSDDDGNLLIDSWEKRFFGAVGITDPFGNADGDAYKNIQEMLEGSDPRDGLGIPSVPFANFAAPELQLLTAGTLGELHFLWPAAYINKFDFGVRHTADLTTPFSDLAVSTPVAVSGDEFKITFAVPATSAHFYYLVVSLR